MNISVSIDARDMKSPPLDASCNGESNKLCLTILGPMDGETP